MKPKKKNRNPEISETKPDESLQKSEDNPPNHKQPQISNKETENPEDEPPNPVEDEDILLKKMA